MVETLWNMDVICVRASLSPSWPSVCRLHGTVLIPVSSVWTLSSFTKTIKMLRQGRLYEMETELDLYFYINKEKG